MQTNIVSLIFLLVFLKNVASLPKLFFVDVINKGSDDDRQRKLREALELIRDEHHHKLQKIIFRDLDKFDETDREVKFPNKDAFNYDEPELDYNEQETFIVDNCRSLRPNDLRECLEYNIKQKIKGQSDKIEMRREPDVFENFKTPEECMALEATLFVQLECLAKFKILPMDNKIIKDFESVEDDFVNIRNPEDCWKLKNTRMSRKLICLKLFYKKNVEINDDDFKNLDDPHDCLILKKTTMQRKLKCLEILEKKNDQEVVMKYDNFENIKDPNECILLKKATKENKLICLEKFEKKKDKIVDAKDIEVDNIFENIKDPTDCLHLKTTVKNKYKCLDQFGKANDEDYEVAFLGDDFENFKEPNDCLFLKGTIEIKLKCLDTFQKVEEKANQKVKEMTIPTADENTLRTEDNKDIKVPEDCLFAHTTYGKKLKCLDQLEKHKENIRSRSIEPNHQFIAARPKRKIYSLYNYYNAVMNPVGFKDLTRQEFSQDYLDISELSRSIPKCRTPACNVDLLKLSYQLKEKKADPRNNSRRIFDSVHTRYIQADSNDDSDEIQTPKPKKRKVQKKKNGVPIRFTVVSKEERPPPDDSESEEHKRIKAEVNGESFEDREDSEEEHLNLKKNKKSPKKKQKSSEEEKDKKSFLSFQSEEDVNKGISSESESLKKSFVKNKKKKEKNEKKEKKFHVDDDYSIETERPSSFKYSYIQGNKIVDFFRRRLEHFLPKRFHWEEADFKNLGYYWYDGPRGRWTK